MKKRTPYEIEKSVIMGTTAESAEETAITIHERFGPPETDEESRLFGTMLIDADVDPMSESVQRPKARKG